MHNRWSFDLQCFADGDPAVVPPIATLATGDAPDATLPPAQPANPQSILGGNQPAAVPEKYELTLPEGTQLDETLLQEFSGVAKEAGLTNDMANKIADMHFGLVGKAVQAVNDEIMAERSSWADSAKQELGGQFNATVQTAGIGVEWIEKQIPGIREAFDKTGFGNTVEGIRLMAALGKLVQEDPANRDLGAGLGGQAALYSDMKL